MRTTPAWSLVVMLAGCSASTEPGTSPPVEVPPPVASPQVATPPAAAETYTFADNWKGSPCLPMGAVRSLRGRVVIEPFGKGTDGARLVDADGKRWVLTYRAEEPLTRLAGAEVEVRGRECGKQGEAIGGPHFDLASVTVLSRGDPKGAKAP